MVKKSLIEVVVYGVGCFAIGVMTTYAYFKVRNPEIAKNTKVIEEFVKVQTELNYTMEHAIKTFSDLRATTYCGIRDEAK